ncbi:MAG: hypothetical protein KIG76_04125 [Eubacteriales bacterium]|nr:hypothetical protein [Candidatus Colimorpha enterica]
MKKAFSLLMVLMILMGCVAVFPVIGSASSDALSAQAYILNNGDETNTHIYVVFNKKITDYSSAVLYNRTVNGEVLAEVLSTIAQENEYTLKYTIAAGNSYVVPWKFTNVSGSLHYTVTPKAGEAELPLADTAGIRNGDTGWAEVATPCYTVSYEVVTSVDEIPVPKDEEEIPTVDTSLTAQAYILNNGDETNTHIYIVFNKKITDYSTAVLYNRTVNGEVLAEVLSTIAQENEYTLKYTIAAGNSYVVPWKFTNVSGSLHYAVTPKAGEAELPLADTAGIRNGDTGWAEVATPCYTVSYEVVTSIKDIPGFESEEPPVHTHTPGEATRENVVDAQIGVEGSYDEVVRCTECGEIVSSTHVTIPALKALSAKVYTIAGESKLYIVFSKKVSLDPENGTTLVLGPAGILSEQAVQIDEYTIAVDNSDPQFNLATILKNGWDGVEQKAYIWSNNVATADGEKLPMNDKVTVWGEERSLYLLTYEGEYSTIEDVPTGDASLTVFGMILVVSAIGIGVTTKKKKVS